MGDFDIQIDVDTSKAEAKIDALVNKKREINIETKVDGKSTQKEVDSVLDEIGKKTKKNPVELGFDTRVFNANMAQIKSSADGLFRMFAGTNALDFGGNKIREAISELKELDTALVEIDKTSNLSQSALKSLAENSFSEASKYGALLQDYMDSAGEFARAGYSNLSDITDLAMLTQIAGNVTADEANKYIIATDAAYKYKGAVEDLTKVVDGANYIANKNSVEVQDIAKAATVSASFAAQAGVSVEQLTAAEGTMSAVTKRSGSEMGRAFRSILLNLQQVSGEFDGEVIDQEQLKKVEARCHSLGVELEYLNDGVATLRNPMEVLEELSDVYNSLPDNSADKQGLISDLGGKYHANALASLLGNWDLYEKILKEFSEGEGSALNEAQKSAESWQGRLNSLKNTWLEFADGFVSNDFMKGSISGLEGMIHIFDNLNDAQLFIPSFLSSMLALRNMFTGKGLTDIGISQDGIGSLGKLDVQGNLFGIDFTKMGQWKKHFSEAEKLINDWNTEVLSGQANVEKFGGSFVKENDNFRKYISSVKDGTASLDGYKKSLSATGVQYKKFSMKSVLANAATGFLAGTAIELGLAGIMKLVDYMTSGQKRMIEAAESSRSAWETTKSGIESLNKELDTTQQRINELNAKGHLTIAEEAELSKLQMQNAELEKQLDLQQKIEERQHLQAAQDAQKVLNSRSAKNAADDGSTGIVAGLRNLSAEAADALGLEGIYNGGLLAMVTGDEISKGSDEYEILSDKIKQAAAAQKELKELQDSQNESNYNEVQKQIDKKQSEVNDLESVVNAQYQAMQKIASVFYDDEGNYVDGFEKDAKKFEKIQKEYLGMDVTKLAKSKESSLNTLFAKKDFDGLKESLIDAAKSGGTALDTLITSTPGLSSALKQAGLSADDLKKNIMSLAEPDSYNIDEVKKQLTKSFADIGDIATKEDTDQYNRRTAAFKRFSKDLSDEDIEIFYKYVNENDIDLSQLDAVDLAGVFENAKASAQETAGAIDTITDSSNKLLTSISAVKSVLSSQQTGKTISPEDFNSEELSDYQSALEYVNGSMQLNTDKVKELSKAKVEEKVATNDALKAQKQQDYLKNAAEIDTLRRKLEENNLAQGESAESIQTNIDALLNSNSAIVGECAQIDVLNSALRESIGVYQQWLDAQNGSDYGDMFSDSQNAYQRIMDTYDRDSDIYGDFGSQKFDAAVDFLVPDTVDKSDTDAIGSYMDSVSRYLTFDKNGNTNGMDIANFCQDSVDKGLMVLDEAGENYEIAGQTTMEDFANGLNLSLPMVRAFFDELQLKDWEFDWGDESFSSFGDGIMACEQSATELEAEIDTLTQQRDAGIEIDGSKLDELQQKLDEVNQKKHELEQQSTANIEANIEIDQQIQNAKSEVEGWKASLEADPTNVEIQANVENAEANLQELENQKQELQTPTSVEIQASLQSVTSDIASVQEQINNFSNKDYTAKFNISDEDAAAKVQELQGQLSTLEGQKMSIEVYAEAHGAESAIENIDKKEVTDKKFGISAIDNASSTITAIDNMQIADKSFTVTEHHVIMNSTIDSGGDKKSGVQELNGTAHAAGNFKMQHAYGTAMANGSWAAKQGGTTLVGELGREIVVDPYSGRWHTVGDNGAEFTHIPKGAIVFNHRQTEALLERGWVNGRGSAMASGTALVGGKGPSSSTIKSKNQHSYSSIKSKSSNSSSSSANTKATNNNTDATRENTKSNKSLQDWIEQLVSVQKAENGRLYDAIEDFEMNANQNKAIDTYVGDSESYMDTLRQAQNRYMTKANALGVPGNYVHKIWAGELDIEDIQDEDLKEKISQYQTWYEKAKDLGDEIVDINRKIRETKIKKLDNIKDDYENLVSLSESMADYNESISDLSEKLNLVGDSKALKKSMDMQAAMREALVNEQKQLTTQLNALVADGTIAKNTDTWNKWQEEINKVKKSIVDCDSALADLKKNIMEIRYSKFEQSLDNLDFTGDMASSVRDLMNKEGIYDDDVQLTSTGYAQLALMSTELTSAKQKTVNYQAAINALKKDLKNGNITQAQYNEKLQEYQKGQMDAAKSTKSAKDAILDLVKNGIEKQTEAMEKLINKRKEELQKMKEADDYQKNMADRSKEINAIKAQIAALEGNDSKEAIAQKKNLNSQLQKLQDEYDETRKDHEYDVISQGYDSQLEKFKENQEAVTKELESSTEAQQKAISEVLEATKNQQAAVYEELKAIAGDYQMSLTDSLTKPWSDAQAALKQFQDSMGKLNANVSIDTSKIKPTKPSKDKTTPTKNESNKQTVDKSKTGTWLKQNGRWWYQHSDGTYTKNAWEAIDGQWYKFDEQGWMQTGWQPWGVDKNGQALWYYMTDSGNMAASTWIDDKYYVDHTGAMARNGYVKSKDSGLYYWVNGDGVWEPQWNTYTPDLKKYKLYYESGTSKAKDGLAFMDDKDHKLKLGSEAIITQNGVLGNFGGSAIFNERQTEFLHKFSDNPSYIPNVYTPKLPDYSNYEVKGGGDTYNVHYDNLLNVEGNVTKDVFPGMKKMCEESFQYTTRKLHDYHRQLGLRKPR